MIYAFGFLLLPFIKFYVFHLIAKRVRLQEIQLWCFQSVLPQYPFESEGRYNESNDLWPDPINLSLLPALISRQQHRPSRCLGKFIHPRQLCLPLRCWPTGARNFSFGTDSDQRIFMIFIIKSHFNSTAEANLQQTSAWFGLATKTCNNANS